MSITGYPVSLTDVTTCQPSRCPDNCDAQEECVVRAVSKKGGESSPYLFTNLYGGDLDQWTGVKISEWNDPGDNADAVACLGDFVVIVSNGESAIVYSDDGGTTRVEVTLATYAPRQLDMIDQGFIVVCADSGRIWGSYDAARTWEVLDDGNATTKQLNRVMIARTNPQVIYAVGNTDTIIKSENGGETWFEPVATPTGSTNITALWVENQSRVLVGTSAGEVFETVDGGATWTEQVDLPSISSATIKEDTTISDIVACGCGVYWLVTKLTDTDGIKRVYRNVDGGASGRWFNPEPGAAATYDLEAIACCSSNRAIAVGGNGTGIGDVILFA